MHSQYKNIFYTYLTFYLKKEYINIQKSVLFIEKLAVSQKIIFNRSIIISKNFDNYYPNYKTQSSYE